MCVIREGFWVKDILDPWWFGDPRTLLYRVQPLFFGGSNDSYRNPILSMGLKSWILCEESVLDSIGGPFGVKTGRCKISSWASSSFMAKHPQKNHWTRKMAWRHFEDLNSPCYIQVRSNPSRMEGPSDPCRAKSTKPRREPSEGLQSGQALLEPLDFSQIQVGQIGWEFVRGVESKGPPTVEGFRNLTFTSWGTGSLSHNYRVL